MESLEERDCSDGGPGGAGPVVGNVAVAVVIGSSVAMATTQGPEFLWVDIAVHLVVFAVAFIASIRNNRALGLLFVVLSPLVMFWGLSQLDLQGCMYYGGERCETGTELVVGAYVVGTALLAGGAALRSARSGNPPTPPIVAHAKRLWSDTKPTCWNSDAKAQSQKRYTTHDSSN